MVEPLYCVGIRVPRSRFLPVKTTSDLLLIMSDLYMVRNGSLVMNPKRGFTSVPLVKLGDENFKNVILQSLKHNYFIYICHHTGKKFSFKISEHSKHARVGSFNSFW